MIISALTFVRPSPTYAGCLYCERCRAHYTPNQKWGFLTTTGPTVTTGGLFVGVHQKGRECPFCGATEEPL